MAATVNVISSGEEGGAGGDTTLVVFDFTPDNSYPTGGYSLAGLGGTVHAVVGSTGGYLLQYDPSTQKVKMFRQTAATSALIEVPNTTDLSAVPAARLVAVVQG